MYRAEDAEFRDRMRRAYSIAATVCLNMRAGLARVRMARAFRETADAFAAPVELVARVAFLYGRAYGRSEAGAVERVDVPEREALAAEPEASPDLKQ